MPDQITDDLKNPRWQLCRDQRDRVHVIFWKGGIAIPELAFDFVTDKRSTGRRLAARGVTIMPPLYREIAEMIISREVSEGPMILADRIGWLDDDVFALGTGEIIRGTILDDAARRRTTRAGCRSCSRRAAAAAPTRCALGGTSWF